MAKNEVINVGLDLMGVIIHNNKSLGTGDLPKDQRDGESVRRIHQEGKLPTGYYITKVDDIVFIDGALEAIARLRRDGIRCYIISNQEAINVGLLEPEEWYRCIEYIGMAIQRKGGQVAGWAFCPHLPEEGCDCRKPKPGMFEDLRSSTFLPDNTYYVGDNPSDMEAGARFGCKENIHIKLATADKEFQKSEYADAVVADLGEAVSYILRREEYE